LTALPGGKYSLLSFRAEFLFTLPMTPPAPQPRRRVRDQRIRPTRAEVDLGALRHNLSRVGHFAPGAGVLAVVKANAYGHGAVAVARALEAAGVAWLGVALVEEGLELRAAGVEAPILVLGGAYAGAWDQLLSHRLTPVLFRAEHFTAYAAAAAAVGQRAPFHLEIDTGVGRTGILPRELAGTLAQLRALPGLELEGVLSHFASSDAQDREGTRAQAVAFRTLLAQVEAAGFAPRFRHVSNTAAVLDLQALQEVAGLNLVRPGLMLYGLAPGHFHAADLRPVLTWKTGIVHIKDVPAGTPISYGGTFVTPRPSRIATLPVGYADGYERAWGNRAHVLVRGARVPVVGRVCMDLCMVDVTDVPGVELGDEVVLLGRQAEGRVAVEELAGLSATIPYEVLCGISARVPREPVGG
jgi:alanine racemase